VLQKALPDISKGCGYESKEKCICTTLGAHHEEMDMLLCYQRGREPVGAGEVLKLGANCGRRG
jgi:hypothetical protein